MPKFTPHMLASVRLLSAMILLLAVAPSIVVAQRPDMSDRAFAQSVATLLTHDHFATKCAAGGGMSAGEAEQVEAWAHANGVGMIRTRLRELEQDPAQKAKVDEAYAGVVRKYGQLSLFACRAALQSSKRPEAQFATTEPAMLVALGTPAASPSPVDSAIAEAPPVAVRPAAAPPAAAPPAAPPPTGSPADEIDSFGFDSRPKMGVGGFMTVDVYPIVLFRNGEALTDVEGLAFPAGLAAHKRANPGDWTQWRRSGGALLLHKQGRWAAPSFQRSYPRLPDGFRLDGYFRALSGAGTVAIGGGDAVAAFTDYRFSPDGRVERGSGSGGRAEAGDGSVVTRASAPSRRGRYQLDGLTLRISYDDGSEESHVLIADPADPKTAIWLDGVGYARRKR